MSATATFHFFFILKPFAMTDPAGQYTGLFCFAGLAAYVWTLLPDRVRPSRDYTVVNLEKTGGALAITMKPKKKGLKVAPGQFGVLRFMGHGSDEPHPFSFSQIGDDGSLRVTIKALGDFTSRLEGSVKVGHPVSIQGPFGRFRLSGKSPEVWIAGGVGITPFLAWAQALDPEGATVDLFYCVRSRSNAPHLAELEDLAKVKPNLRLHLVVSSEGQRLSADIIAETVKGDLAQSKVSFCGPVLLRGILQTGLRRFGVTSRRFHFEEFEFRTGIGLKYLAAWIWERRVLGAASNVSKYQSRH